MFFCQLSGKIQSKKQTNGLIIPPKDKEALLKSMKELIMDKYDDKKFGIISREIIGAKFIQEYVWEELKEYQRLIKDKCLM